MVALHPFVGRYIFSEPPLCEPSVFPINCITASVGYNVVYGGTPVLSCIGLRTPVMALVDPSEVKFLYRNIPLSDKKFDLNVALGTVLPKFSSTLTAWQADQIHPALPPLDIGPFHVNSGKP